MSNIASQSHQLAQWALYLHQQEKEWLGETRLLHLALECLLVAQVQVDSIHTHTTAEQYWQWTDAGVGKKQKYGTSVLEVLVPVGSIVSVGAHVLVLVVVVHVEIG